MISTTSKKDFLIFTTGIAIKHLKRILNNKKAQNM